jgi:murein DD-endopeptidase MepM/ murein hydrolase activator NlpD
MAEFVRMHLSRIVVSAVVVLGVVFVGNGLVQARSAPSGLRLSRFYNSGPAVGAINQVRDARAVAQAPASAAPAAPAKAEIDPARPYGVPVTRGDWVITKDYAAHGGLRPAPGNNQGAVDFAFWHNKDALGADVVATHSGRVKLLQDDPTYGNLVYVLGPRWSTTYGHLQGFTVKEGDTVQRGQVIGHMGSTGASSGPHVDYQVWENGANRNPMDYCNCGTRGPDTPKE